ncbi:MAG: hypothetical protein L6R39_003504 [Caloplaca ligustica]|nr:MAG: hypothetical protein L6R39_003504 [Caloplaca ligustica]
MLRARTSRVPKAALNNLKGPTRVAAEYGTAHYARFFNTFNREAARKRVQRRPEPLSAEGHAALRQQVSKVNFITPDYADTTKVNIPGILGKWQLFCCFNKKMLGGCKPTAWKAALTNAGWKALMQTFDWKSPLKDVDRTVSISFLYWIRDNYQIKSLGAS